MLSALVDRCATGTASSSEPKRQTESTKSSKSSRKKGRIQRARERERSKPRRESTLLILALVSSKSSWVRDSTAGTGWSSCFWEEGSRRSCTILCLLKQFQDDFFYIRVYLLGLRFKKAWLSSWFLTSWMEQQQRTQIRRWKATPNQKSTCSKSRLWPYSSERGHFASEHKRTMSLPMSGRRRSSPRRLFGIHNERTTRWDSCEVQAKTKCVSKSAADLEVMAVPWMCHVLWMCLSLCICSHFFAFIRDQQTWSLQVCTQLMLDSGQDYVDATVAVWCCVFFGIFKIWEEAYFLFRRHLRTTVFRTSQFRTHLCQLQSACIRSTAMYKALRQEKVQSIAAQKQQGP